MTTHVGTAGTTSRMSGVSTTLTRMYGPISCLCPIVPLGIGQVYGEEIL